MAITHRFRQTGGFDFSAAAKAGSNMCRDHDFFPRSSKRITRVGGIALP